MPTWQVDAVSMIAAQCNKQKYNAKKAGELSTELYILKYIELNTPIITEAVVVEVREKYIDVIVVCMGLNRRIFFNNVSLFFILIANFTYLQPKLDGNLVNSAFYLSKTCINPAYYFFSTYDYALENSK